MSAVLLQSLATALQTDSLIVAGGGAGNLNFSALAGACLSPASNGSTGNGGNPSAGGNGWYQGANNGGGSGGGGGGGYEGGSISTGGSSFIHPDGTGTQELYGTNSGPVNTSDPDHAGNISGESGDGRVVIEWWT